MKNHPLRDESNCSKSGTSQIEDEKLNPEPFELSLVSMVVVT